MQTEGAGVLLRALRQRAAGRLSTAQYEEVRGAVAAHDLDDAWRLAAAGRDALGAALGGGVAAAPVAPAPRSPRRRALEAAEARRRQAAAAAHE